MCVCALIIISLSSPWHLARLGDSKSSLEPRKPMRTVAVTAVPGKRRVKDGQDLGYLLIPRYGTMRTCRSLM